MSKRAVHLYPWDGGTEADSDMPDHVYCGTEGDFTDDQLTNDWRYVTCKRCLKLHEREKAWQAAEDRDQKVKLFDEAQIITMDLGYMNISTAIKALIAENERLGKTMGAIDKELRGKVNDPDPLPSIMPGAFQVETTYGLVAGIRRERDQLKAQHETLRKDARRYRWLRENHILAHVQVTQSDGSEPYVYAEELDRSVDEILDAMSKEAANAGSAKG